MFDLFKRLMGYVAGSEPERCGPEEDWHERQRSADVPNNRMPDPQEFKQTPAAERPVSLFTKPSGLYQSHESAEQDRLLMPPPSSRRKLSNVHRFKRPSSVAGSLIGSDADVRSMVTKGSLTSKLGSLFNIDQERRALEHAEAFHIHPDSGFWYQSEAGLYEHLWIRGKEPLLPFAWAPDFKTYPTALFNLDQDDIPLITNIYSPQFHAIRALRELVELGHQVRDQMLAGFKLVKIQRTIQKGIEAYIDWALNDADLYSTADTVPLHHTARRHPEKTTIEAISALATKLHNLLDVHRQSFPDTPTRAPKSPSPSEHARDPATSGAMPPPSPTRDSEDPQILDDSQGDLPPVMIGFLVVGATATIFTLNARNADAALAGDRTRGVHMLGRFNFTESRFDVWNALAIALTVCHLRSALLAVAKPDSEDEDARHGTVAGYLSKEEFEATKKRKRENTLQNDPDAMDIDGSKGKHKGKAKAKETVDGAKRHKASPRYDDDPDR